MGGYFGDLYNNIVVTRRPVDASIHLVQSFGVAACGVIVFGPAKKVLGDRVFAGRPELSLTSSLTGLPLMSPLPAVCWLVYSGASFICMCSRPDAARSSLLSSQYASSLLLQATNSIRCLPVSI